MPVMVVAVLMVGFAYGHTGLQYGVPVCVEGK